jgi:hypothetical protein
MKMNRLIPMVGLVCFAVVPCPTGAATLADWTFETSQPATAGPFSPEIGSGSAWGLHASSSAVYSSPDGNGSAHSFNVTRWAIGDYFEFQVSALGYDDLNVSYDQVSSPTGPKIFNFSYSTDGTSFTDFVTGYTVLSNASPNPVWNATTPHSIYTYSYNLSSVLALNNAANVYFRIVDASTVSAGGGTVGTAGTDRIDNFIVMATAVPEPAGCVLLGLAGVIGAFKLFKERSTGKRSLRR